METDLAQMSRSLGHHWLLILFAGLLGASVAAVHAFYLATPFYRASAIVSVDNGQVGQTSPNLGQFSGIASLAGINLGSAASKRNEFIAFLTSRKLATAFLASHDILPVLVPEQYDATASRWIKARPPLELAVTRFLESRLRVTENRTTGLLSIQLVWPNPEHAAQWLNEITALANQMIKDQAGIEAKQNLDFLRKQIAEERVDTVRQSITRLMELNLNQAMMANVQQEFPFRFIDPPEVPILPYWPMRSVEVAAGGLAGVFLACLFALFRHRKRIFVRVER